MPLEQIAEGAIPDAGLRRPDAELDAQARAETEAGVGIPIEDVETWVESWDTPTELPMPRARRVS